MAYTCKDSCDSSSADSCEDFESTSGSSSSEESAILNLILYCSMIKATIGTVNSAECSNKALSTIDRTIQDLARSKPNSKE